MHAVGETDVLDDGSAGLKLRFVAHGVSGRGENIDAAECEVPRVIETEVDRLDRGARHVQEARVDRGDQADAERISRRHGAAHDATGKRGLIGEQIEGARRTKIVRLLDPRPIHREAQAGDGLRREHHARRPRLGFLRFEIRIAAEYLLVRADEFIPAPRILIKAGKPRKGGRRDIVHIRRQESGAVTGAHHHARVQDPAEAGGRIDRIELVGGAARRPERRGDALAVRGVVVPARGDVEFQFLHEGQLKLRRHERHLRFQVGALHALLLRHEGATARAAVFLVALFREGGDDRAPRRQFANRSGRTRGDRAIDRARREPAVHLVEEREKTHRIRHRVAQQIDRSARDARRRERLARGAHDRALVEQRRLMPRVIDFALPLARQLHDDATDHAAVLRGGERLEIVHAVVGRRDANLLDERIVGIAGGQDKAGRVAARVTARAVGAAEFEKRLEVRREIMADGDHQRLALRRAQERALAGGDGLRVVEIVAAGVRDERRAVVTARAERPCVTERDGRDRRVERSVVVGIAGVVDQHEVLAGRTADVRGAADRRHDLAGDHRRIVRQDMRHAALAQIAILREQAVGVARARGDQQTGPAAEQRRARAHVDLARGGVGVEGVAVTELQLHAGIIAAKDDVHDAAGRVAAVDGARARR